MNPTPLKFAIGIIFVGLGFLVLVAGMESSDGVQTAIWIILIYLLHTLGELCYAVETVIGSRLSPQRIVGVMMGMWFLPLQLGIMLPV